MLHMVFLLSILIMIICSVATILSFKQSADTLPKVGPDNELSTSELLTLSCGVLFFLSFFVAMYVEVKAELTIYQVSTTYPSYYIINSLILSYMT